MHCSKSPGETVATVETLLDRHAPLEAKQEGRQGRRRMSHRGTLSDGKEVPSSAKNTAETSFRVVAENEIVADTL